MMSTDTDLLPALRFVYDHDLGVIHAAVAAWGIPTDSRRLRLPGASVWCHWLDQTDYNAVADSEQVLTPVGGVHSVITRNGLLYESRWRLIV